MIYYTKKQANSGFTLIETLISITILLIVISGPLLISTQTARSTDFSSEQITAFFLAQEGSELVQKYRDDMALRKFIRPTTDVEYESDPWGKVTDSTASGFLYDCFTTAGCGLEIKSDAQGGLKNPVQCSGVNCRLFLDNGNSRAHYTHTNTGVETPYVRVIKLSLEPNQQLKILSEVSWYSVGSRQEKKVSVDTYLNDIYSY